MILLLIFLLLPTLALAQDKEVVTTGSKPFSKGTTKNPQFTVPDKSDKVFRIEITCDPTAEYSVITRESTDGGKTWTAVYGFTRKPGPCIAPGGGPLPTIGVRHSRSAPFSAGTILQSDVITNKAITATLDLTFDKSQ